MQKIFTSIDNSYHNVSFFFVRSQIGVAKQLFHLTNRRLSVMHKIVANFSWQFARKFYAPLSQLFLPHLAS